MRTLGLVVAGFVGGALLGLMLAYLFVVLTFDVFAIFSAGADGMSGLAALLLLAPLLGLLFGTGGAVLLAVKGRRREDDPM